MIIIGNGQLAKIFLDSDLNNTCIFASGVSNSNCTDINEFEREKNLLLKTLNENKENKFVYFSSCALSAKDYKKNEYYLHKQNMENLIKENSNNYYIFRVPQLFGCLKTHPTLINFIYNSIKDDKEFNLYDEAYRYVIEINDVKILVEKYLTYSDSCITIDLSNTYRYKVLDIVNILETLLNKKAKYALIEKKDGYILDLSDLKNFMKKNKIKINFSENYLKEKLAQKVLDV